MAAAVEAEGRKIKIMQRFQEICQSITLPDEVSTIWFDFPGHPTNLEAVIISFFHFITDVVVRGSRKNNLYRTVIKRASFLDGFFPQFLHHWLQNQPRRPKYHQRYHHLCLLYSTQLHFHFRPRLREPQYGRQFRTLNFFLLSNFIEL